MLLERAKETLSSFWEEIGASNFNDLTVNELEALLKRIESFHKLVLETSKKSDKYSEIETDCKAQMALVVMRQNYLMSGKYFNDKF